MGHQPLERPDGGYGYDSQLTQQVRAAVVCWFDTHLAAIAQYYPSLSWRAGRGWLAEHRIQSNQLLEAFKIPLY